MDRLSYVHNFGETMTDEERQAAWLAPEPEETYPPDLPEEEVKKREDEKAKKAAEETEEVTTMAKRKGYKMYLHGENFVKKDSFSLVFTWLGEEEQRVTKVEWPIFKNSKCVAFCVPDMGVDVPIGNHSVHVEATCNDQQFTNSGLTFLYNSVDPKLTEEDLRKLDEEEAKNAKKNVKKK